MEIRHFIAIIGFIIMIILLFIGSIDEAYETGFKDGQVGKRR